MPYIAILLKVLSPQQNRWCSAINQSKNLAALIKRASQYYRYVPRKSNEKKRNEGELDGGTNAREIGYTEGSVTCEHSLATVAMAIARIMKILKGRAA